MAMHRVSEDNLCREAIPLSWFHIRESSRRLLAALFQAIYKLGQSVSYNYLPILFPHNGVIYFHRLEHSLSARIACMLDAFAYREVTFRVNFTPRTITVYTRFR